MKKVDIKRIFEEGVSKGNEMQDIEPNLKELWAIVKGDVIANSKLDVTIDVNGLQLSVKNQKVDSPFSFGSMLTIAENSDESFSVNSDGQQMGNSHTMEEAATAIGIFHGRHMKL